MEEASAVILANMGRFVGNLKGLVRIAGKPMIEYVLDSIPDEVSDITIGVDDEGSVSAYDDLAERYLARVAVIGPWEGSLRKEVEAAVRSAEGDRVLILPCDVPLITMEFTKFLVDASKKFTAVLPRMPSRRVSYLTASYQKKPLEKVFDEAPDAGMDEVVRRIKGAIYLSSSSLKIFDEKLNMFFRINHKADLSRAERFLRRRIP